MGFCTGRPALYKSEFCEIAIKVLSEGESLAAVCAEIGIGRTTLYKWRDENPEFKEAIEVGLQIAQRDWEKIGKQGITGQIDKFAGTPWMFTMKNRFRDDYKDDKKPDEAKDALIHAVLDKLVE